MIIKSLIQDEGKVTFECAKATISKDSIIEIADVYFKEKEIQTAMKLGMIEIVGTPPALPEEPKPTEPERKIKFQSLYTTKLCFECLRDYVDPDKFIHIPVSKLEEREIRNAISAGWLLNVENPESTPPPSKGPALHLEELTVKDILLHAPLIPEPPKMDMSDLDQSLKEVMSILQNPTEKTASPLPEGVPAARPKPKSSGPIKAKKIASSADADIDGEDDDGGDLYKPSEIALPKPKAKKSTPPPSAPIAVEDTPSKTGDDDDFNFMDVFTEKQPKKKK